MKLFALVSLLTTALSGCVKPSDCARYFQISARILPVQETYHVGDTIRVVSSFYKRVAAFNSEEKEIETFDMAGINWKPITSIFRVDTIKQTGLSSITASFEFLKNPAYDYDLFQASNQASFLNGGYHYSNDSFSLEINLIAKRPGVFMLRQESGVLAGPGEQQDYPGRCGKDGFDVWVKMNGGEGNHLDLIQASPDSDWSKGILENPEANFNRRGAYCFKVVPK